MTDGISIVRLTDNDELMDTAVQYFWKCWGSESNFSFYDDCIRHSVNTENGLPGFYLAIRQGEIIGSYALLVNDLVSRQDLMPWLACLYVNEEFRGQGIGRLLLDHALRSAAKLGFRNVYLSTDLEGYYEGSGWSIYTYAFNPSGEKWKVYSHPAIEG